MEDLIRTCPSTTVPTVSRSPDVLIDGKPLVDVNCVQPADIEMIEVLNVHNGLRSQYGAPPLVWDPVLVQGAQGYVNHLSRTGQLVHASREGRGTIRENISQGLPNYRARQLMDNWLNERRYFFPGTFPNVSTTGDWYQVGHFSQMIWPTTTTIGCARGIGAGSSWLVCRYDPGGNKDGKPVGVPPVQVAQGDREQEYQGASITLNKRLARRGSTSGQAPSQTPYHPPPGTAGIFNTPLTSGLCLDPAPDGAPLEVRELVYGACYYPIQLEGSDWGYRGVLDGLLQSTDETTGENFAEIRIPLIREPLNFFEGQHGELFTDQGYQDALDRRHRLSTAPDATIRPRLIGGDYGGKIEQGQTPATELPWHPDFNPRGKRPEADQGVPTSLFSLGIYGGIEPWDNSGLAYRNFDRDPDHEYVGLAVGLDDGASVFDDLDIHAVEWALDDGWFLHDFSGPTTPLIRYNQLQTRSILDTAPVDTKVEQPTLPTAEMSKSSVGNEASANGQEDEEEEYIKAEVGEFDFYDYEKAVKQCDLAGMQKHMESLKAKVEAAKELLEQVEEAAAMGAPTEPTLEKAKWDLSSAEHYLGLAQKLSANPETAKANTEVDTKVEQPQLPGKESHNPADQPKCPLEIM
ncbi:MAG: CAP domain-containing protein [Alphaproteobacteria bacterium]